MNNIEKIFLDLPPKKYDLLNHLLSLGLDITWRRKLIKNMRIKGEERLLDICTGTGDLLLEARKYTRKIVGVDISYPMISRAEEKVKDAALVIGDALKLPFMDNSFHKVIMGFGLRNLYSPEQGIKEAYRVLRPGGKIGILEFSPLPSKLIRWPYYFYLGKIIPELGGIISGKKGAYLHLSQSIKHFIPPSQVAFLMKKTGLTKIKYLKLSMGIAIIFFGTKEEK